jgi:hypothetical protein
MGVHGNLYFNFLSCLHWDEEESPSRHPSDFQFYICHENYRDTINTCYQEQYPDKPKACQLTTRCRVAAEILAEESDKVVRATLSSAWGAETSGGIQSINIGTRRQERKYYTPSGGI